MRTPGFKNQGKPHKPSHKVKPLLSKGKGAKKFKKGEWHNVGERAERTQLTNDWLEQVQKLPGVTADFSFATGAVRAIKVIFDDYDGHSRNVLQLVKSEDRGEKTKVFRLENLSQLKRVLDLIY